MRLYDELDFYYAGEWTIYGDTVIRGSTSKTLPSNKSGCNLYQWQKKSWQWGELVRDRVCLWVSLSLWPTVTHSDHGLPSLASGQFGLWGKSYCSSTCSYIIHVLLTPQISISLLWLLVGQVQIDLCDVIPCKIKSQFGLWFHSSQLWSRI
jgi:hypothetical protein